MRAITAAALLSCIRSAASAATFSVVGTAPQGALIGAANANNLYGVTQADGSGNGTLFRLTIGHAAVALHVFAGNDGRNATAPLALAADGTITGISTYGGLNGGGTLWRYKSGTFTVLHPFGAAGDGDTPFQGPVRDIGGNIYGATAGGAVATNGNAFRYSAAGTYASLHDFLSGADGHCPFSGVARSRFGFLYGTTVGHGFGGHPTGSVWKMSPAGKLVTIHVFANGADGEYPDQAPTVDDQGNVYGTTRTRNGAAFDGAVWTISAAGAFKVLHDFTAATDGAGPNAPLVLGGDGNLYGTTATGGAGGQGTLFSISPGGGFAVVHAFAGGADGAAPTGGLARSAKGAIFGAVQTGQVFQVTP